MEKALGTEITTYLLQLRATLDLADLEVDQQVRALESADQLLTKLQQLSTDWIQLADPLLVAEIQQRYKIAIEQAQQHQQRIQQELEQLNRNTHNLHGYLQHYDTGPSMIEFGA